MAKKKKRSSWREDVPWSEQVRMWEEQERKAYEREHNLNKGWNFIPVSRGMKWIKRWRKKQK